MISREEGEKNRARDKHLSRSKKSLKLVGSNSSRTGAYSVNESRDIERLSEMDIFLDQQMAITLDQDLERCKTSDRCKSSDATIDYDVCVYSSGGNRMSFRKLFEIESDSFMTEFKFVGTAVATRDEVRSAIWEMFQQRMKLLDRRTNILEAGPMDLIADFFSDLEEEVNDICDAESHEWEAAGRIYLQNLCQSYTSLPACTTSQLIDVCKTSQKDDENTVATVDVSLDSSQGCWNGNQILRTRVIWDPFGIPNPE